MESRKNQTQSKARDQTLSGLPSQTKRCLRSRNSVRWRNGDGLDKRNVCVVPQPPWDARRRLSLFAKTSGGRWQLAFGHCGRDVRAPRVAAACQGCPISTGRLESLPYIVGAGAQILTSEFRLR